MAEQINNLKKTVDELDHLLRGNGDRSGLAYKIGESSDCIERVEKEIDKITTELDKFDDAVFGTTKDNPGMLSRISAIEVWMETRKWLERVIIVAVVGEVLLELFSLIRAGIVK